MIAEDRNLWTKRRGWLDIVAEMLRIARNGKLKTHIRFKAGLSHSQVNKYLPFLVEKGLIENLTVKKRKLNIKLYRTTQKGLRFIEILESMKKLEDSPEKRESRKLGSFPTFKRKTNKICFQDNISEES